MIVVNSLPKSKINQNQNQKVMLKVKVRVTIKVTGVCACRKIKTLGEVRVTIKVLRFNMVKWFRFNQPR